MKKYYAGVSSDEKLSEVMEELGLSSSIKEELNKFEGGLCSGEKVTIYEVNLKPIKQYKYVEPEIETHFVEIKKK